MTDRYAGYVVTMDRDVRDDDAEVTVAAIRQIRGVLAVDPLVADAALHVARERVRWELLDKLHKFCREVAGHKDAETPGGG